MVCTISADLSAYVFLFRFPTLSPLKSFPARPLLKDSGDLPRLIRWDDYEELPQSENVAPVKSTVMVRKNASVSLVHARNHAVLNTKFI